MQNRILKTPISAIGYNFIQPAFLPEGKDEYYLRNIQNRSGIAYRQLSAFEIEVLVRNRNSSDNWNNILVSPEFNPELVKNCQFYGLVRIGKLESLCLSFHDYQIPVGIYHSTIISSDLGDNVAIHNVAYLSHYILGNEVIMSNVNECVTSENSKFGNGIIKDGEEENVRIWLEICNENGGRKVMPFADMLPGDAWLWSKYRTDEALLSRFLQFTENDYKTARGYYGKIGDRTVIKNCGIIKDAWIGNDAYIKGASKLKNVTVHSGEEGRTQIGEGSEIVNGIIGYGCRLFYGIKAVRFVMANHSQLKYGARLINSYLGNNATISCCEVLNSLIFPAHEQHHNNSFLCASIIMGQSNIPAGATLGSNHNSRAADGEFIAARGFWPSLCVNIKHNSRFATFSILARGNYAYELDIRIPFSLTSINENTGNLEVMVGYWFLYNMYALTRNAQKYQDRDNRIEKIQLLETDYLAPDTVQDILNGMEIIEIAVGKAFEKSGNTLQDSWQATGKRLLNKKDSIVSKLEITVDHFENTRRKVILTKAQQGYDAFRNMLLKFGYQQLIYALQNEVNIADAIASAEYKWLNVGGQLMPESVVEDLKTKIKDNTIDSWKNVHQYYQDMGRHYPLEKCSLGLSILQNELGFDLSRPNTIEQILRQSLEIEQQIFEAIYHSRSKDYQSYFRKMMYDSDEELEAVIGAFDDNTFIKDCNQNLEQHRLLIDQLLQS